MTLYSHWHRVTWPEVAAVLAREYPGDYAMDAGSFSRAFLAIASKEPKRGDSDGTTISICQFEEDGELYWEVYGIKPDDADHWALDFSPWAELLAMPVDAANERDMTSAEIVAHCLWEMTWHGYEEDVREAKLDSIGKAVGEALERYEAERKERLN